jgi:hypothetical protein
MLLYGLSPLRRSRFFNILREPSRLDLGSLSRHVPNIRALQKTFLAYIYGFGLLFKGDHGKIVGRLHNFN